MIGDNVRTWLGLNVGFVSYVDKIVVMKMIG